MTQEVSLNNFSSSGIIQLILEELSQMDEITFQKYHNRHCSFILNDGAVVYGVAFYFSFPGEEKKQYYFVKSFDLIEFSAAQSVEDWARCRSLANPFSLESVKEAALLDS